MRRAFRTAVVVLAAGLALSGCAFDGLNQFALPGTQGRGDGAYTVRIQLRDAVDGLGEVTSVLVRQRSELENILHNAPTALANFYNIYDPASGSLTGALAASNFQAPAELVCSGLAHAASHDPEQSTGLCKQYLGPLLNALATNYPPIGVNPIVRDGGVPRRDTAAGPALPAGGLDALALPGAGPLPGDAPLPGASLPGAAGPPVPGAAEPAVPDDLAGLLVPTGGRR